MSLKEILSIFETLIDAGLKSGLFSDHNTAKQVLIARDGLQGHADAEAAAAASTPLKVIPNDK